MRRSASAHHDALELVTTYLLGFLFKEKRQESRRPRAAFSSLSPSLCSAVARVPPSSLTPPPARLTAGSTSPQSTILRSYLSRQRSRARMAANGSTSFMSSEAPPAFAVRSATVERITNETKIQCSLSLDVHPKLAPQSINVKTGIGFLDHVRARG